MLEHGMFERFTDQARQAVVFAQDEARALKHNYIGTEHLLLGLLREGSPAARVLSALDVTLEEVRAQVARIVGEGGMPTAGQTPFTPRAKKALELSSLEAERLGHNYIGTEHLLLGLAHEGQGVAMRILEDFDADAEKVRAEIMRVLGSTTYTTRKRRRPLWTFSYRLIAPPLVAFLLGAAVFSLGLLAGWLIWG